MRIKLILPNKTLLDKEVIKISAPGSEGSFQILPRHIDVAWSLDPGILSIEDEDGLTYYAIYQGVLVKQGDTVFVSCYQAIEGDSLESLQETVIHNFKSLNEKEKKAREVLLKLESDTIRRFLDIG